ncbi:Protein of unknown function [Pyronema omphalodes CBS 100304]|uniref:Uncharacterized protein n=1 Tax=Pyronema omphalodes (strain CBS 100304) TaxID=1076935 RepID=U4L4Z9_PYROM|nr:Protein of unknown function [Pyronema omphalodes CBS 100304]
MHVFTDHPAQLCHTDRQRKVETKAEYQPYSNESTTTLTRHTSAVLVESDRTIQYGIEDVLSIDNSFPLVLNLYL